MSARTDELKRCFDLREYILKDTGLQPKVVTKSMVQIYSPFRPKERTPSLSIWPDHFHDFGTNYHGDIYTYIQDTRGMGFMEAYRYLSGDDLPVERSKTPIVYKKETVERATLPLDSLQRYVKQRGTVMTYLLERGITEDIITRNFIGGESFRKVYVGLDGKRFTMEYMRVMLPQIFNGEVYARNFRRDENSCDRALSEFTFDVEEYVRQDLTKREGVEPSDSQIRDALFGPRFWKPKGTRDFIFGLDQIIDYETYGEPHYKNIPYLIVDEGEFNALSLQSIGLRAISCKALRSIGLKRVLGFIDILYVAVHNDKTRVDARGRSFHAGLNYAEMLAEVTRRARSRIRFIELPDEYKDANDMLRAGRLVRFLSDKPYGLKESILAWKMAQRNSSGSAIR